MEAAFYQAAMGDAIRYLVRYLGECLVQIVQGWNTRRTLRVRMDLARLEQQQHQQQQHHLSLDVDGPGRSQQPDVVVSLEDDHPTSPGRSQQEQQEQHHLSLDVDSTSPGRSEQPHHHVMEDSTISIPDN